MKASTIGVLVLACAFFAQSGLAQYKGPRNYFPKNYPAPQPGSGASPAGTNSLERPQQPRFKDLPVNTGFYFLTDSNRTYLWTKTSANQAKNSKNGIVQTISGEAPVQK